MQFNGSFSSYFYINWHSHVFSWICKACQTWWKTGGSWKKIKESEKAKLAKYEKEKNGQCVCLTPGGTLSYPETEWTHLFRQYAAEK
jgi:hypothetical protein